MRRRRAKAATNGGRLIAPVVEQALEDLIAKSFPSFSLWRGMPKTPASGIVHTWYTDIPFGTVMRQPYWAGGPGAFHHGMSLGVGRVLSFRTNKPESIFDMNWEIDPSAGTPK
jgi:hypothetical protein